MPNVAFFGCMGAECIPVEEFSVGPTPDGYSGSILRCENCGLGRLDPVPNAAQLAAAYANYEPLEVGPRVNSGAVLSRLNSIVSHIPQIARRPALLFASVLSARAIPLKYFYPLVSDRTDTVLDFGVASGYYLKLLSSLGFRDLSGYDRYQSNNSSVNIPEADIRRGGEITDMGFPTHRFSLITLIHTLEHVEDPEKLLRELRGFLVEGGRVLIEVPNFGGKVAREQRAQFPHLDPPRHIWHFTAKSLATLLAKTGFRVEEIRYTYSPDVAQEAGDSNAASSIRRKVKSLAGVLSSVMGRDGTELGILACKTL